MYILPPFLVIGITGGGEFARSVPPALLQLGCCRRRLNGSKMDGISEEG